MNAETESNDLNRLLPGGDEPRTQLPQCLEQVAARRKAKPRSNAALDKFLLEQYASLLERHTALGTNLQQVLTTQTELRRMIEELTAPPWRRGVFMRLVQTRAGTLAEVYHGGERRLLRLAEGVQEQDLAVGQLVYLGHELNAVTGVAEAVLPEAGEIATVVRCLEDGRLVLSDRDEQILVEQAEALRGAEVGPGDSVRWNRGLLLAFEPVERKAASELFVTEYLSAQAEQRLGGLSAAVEQVVALFTQGIAHPETAARYGLNHTNTLLMYGPPGNGKTSIARIVGAALAATTGQQCRFASVKGAQLESPWVGATQEAIRDLFRELKRSSLPTLLLIDEVDGIGRHRGGPGGHLNDKFLSTWLTEIDGLERLNDKLGIIALTNRKDLLDQALLDRLSGMELHIGRPGLEAAREIFAVHLPPNLPYGPNGAEAQQTRDDIIEVAVGTLYSPNADNVVAELRFRDGSARTVAARELLSGRTIEQLCIQARRNAFRRHTETGVPGVRVTDMEAAVAEALQRLSTTLTPANARAMLGDLPQDLDVVAVQAVQRNVAAHRYLQGVTHG